MGIQTQFDKFHGSIKLGYQDDAYKKARERDDSITKDVKSAFSDAGYTVVEDFIQGSLATYTGVVPLKGDFDIDRALVIDSSDAPENPVEPKITVLDVLEDRGFTNAKIKKPCVTADYASDNIHIDFPIYKKSGEQYYLAIGKKNSDENNRSWSSSDPNGLIIWVNDKGIHTENVDDKQSQYRRLVRYLKRWRDHNFSDGVASKIYSIALTVMAKQQFSPSFSTEGSRQDLIALHDTVDRIIGGGYFTLEAEGEYRVSVNLPVDPWRDIFDGSSLNTGTQFRNKLINLRDKLAEAAGLDDVVEQANILQKLFGDDFQVPEPPKSNSNSIKKAIYPSAGAVGTSQGA